MLTHRNIVADLRALMEAVPEICDRPFRFLSFLPLSHMFERTVGYYIPIVISGDTQVVFARGIPELPEDLVSQKPSIIVSVPRIFERVYTKIEEGLPVGSPKRKLFDLTVEIGWRRFKNEATLKDRLLWPLLNILVASKLRARLGGEIQYIFLGGAALAPHLLKVFTGVGLTFIHGYGLTETSPVLAANRLADNDPMSVGHPLPGVETRIAGNGELLIRGAIIMKGYWNNPTATSAAIDADGWFHSGDVVEVREGRIYIRGRVKDVIILSNGEKIPPGDAEQAITQDAAFEQVMVIGEGRAHLGLIAVSKLADEKQLCERANRQLHAFPGYAKIRHIMRVSEPWTVDNGLLTPTLKLKRNKIEEKYAREIEAMYKRNDQCSS
jgi:long-chain acyl-CoA synthetase